MLLQSRVTTQYIELTGGCRTCQKLSRNVLVRPRHDIQCRISISSCDPLQCRYSTGITSGGVHVTNVGCSHQETETIFIALQKFRTVLQVTGEFVLTFVSKYICTLEYSRATWLSVKIRSPMSVDFF